MTDLKLFENSYIFCIFFATFSNISSVCVNFCCLYFATTVFTFVSYLKPNKKVT